MQQEDKGIVLVSNNNFIRRVWREFQDQLFNHKREVIIVIKTTITLCTNTWGGVGWGGVGWGVFIISLQGGREKFQPPLMIQYYAQ